MVSLTNATENPEHELQIQEIILEEYPPHELGAIPVLLGHQVSGRKGEYVRATSTIVDAFLHEIMFHALSQLSNNLRDVRLRQADAGDPQLRRHGADELHRRAADHPLRPDRRRRCGASISRARPGSATSSPPTWAAPRSTSAWSPRAASSTTTSSRRSTAGWSRCRWSTWTRSVRAAAPSRRYDRIHDAIKIGPESAGSNPGPACYDRGGLRPTVTDADLLLGYLDPDNYANGYIKLNPKRSVFAIEETLCDELDLDVHRQSPRIIKRGVDEQMAIGIGKELRVRGLPSGGLHDAGLRRQRARCTPAASPSTPASSGFLAPPFSSVFSACGAGNMRPAAHPRARRARRALQRHHPAALRPTTTSSTPSSRSSRRSAGKTSSGRASPPRTSATGSNWTCATATSCVHARPSLSTSIG